MKFEEFDLEWERLRATLTPGQRLRGTVVRVPDPGRIGIFVDLGLTAMGMVDHAVLPREPAFWPLEGTVADFEVLWCDYLPQIRLKPCDVRYLREDYEDSVRRAKSSPSNRLYRQYEALGTASGEVVGRVFDDILLPLGFQRNGNLWSRGSKDVYSSVGMQLSQWRDFQYVDIGFSPATMKVAVPPPSACLVRFRVDALKAISASSHYYLSKSALMILDEVQLGAYVSTLIGRHLAALVAFVVDRESLVSALRTRVAGNIFVDPDVGTWLQPHEQDCRECARWTSRLLRSSAAGITDDSRVRDGIGTARQCSASAGGVAVFRGFPSGNRSVRELPRLALPDCPIPSPPG